MKSRGLFLISMVVILIAVFMTLPVCAADSPQGKTIKAKKLTYAGMKSYFDLVGWGAIPTALAEGDPHIADRAQYTKVTFVMEYASRAGEEKGSYRGRLIALVEPPGGATKPPQVVVEDDMTTLANHIWFSPNSSAISSLFGNATEIGAAVGKPTKFDLYALDMTLQGTTIVPQPKRLVWSSKPVDPTSSKSEIYAYNVLIGSTQNTLASGVSWWEWDPSKGGRPLGWQGAVSSFVPTTEGDRLGVFYDLTPPAGANQVAYFNTLGADAQTGRILPAKVTFYKVDKTAAARGSYYIADRTTIYSYAWKDPAAAVARPEASLKPKAVQTSQDDIYDPFRDMRFLEGFGTNGDSAVPAQYMLYTQYEPNTGDPGNLDIYKITYWIQPLDSKGVPVGTREQVTAPTWDHRITPKPSASVTSYWERISILRHTRDRRYIGVQARTLKRTSSQTEVAGDAAAPPNTECEMNVIVLDPAAKNITETGTISFAYGEGDTVSHPDMLVIGDEVRFYFRLSKASAPAEGYIAKGKVSDFLPPTE